MSADSPALTDVAIVVVTFKRQELLAGLFDSFRGMGEQPATIVVVDNEASAWTEELVAALRADLPATDVVYAPQETNTGGAGGFSAGTRIAYESGAEWIWLMDDDVEVLPGALERLRFWTGRVEGDLARGASLAETHAVIQGQRLNFDGTSFYWQYHFVNRLAIPNPVAPHPFDNDPAAPRTSRPMNTACFEGGLFHRSVVQRLGLPDARFFIYWDDTIYGYLASKITQPLVVSDLILQRTRELAHHRLGTTRKLNTTSDLARYHILRNRGYMAHYLRLHGEYNPVLFGLGTAATVAKEIIRLSLTSERRAGLATVVRGWKDSRKLLRDRSWKPMPPLA